MGGRKKRRGKGEMGEEKKGRDGRGEMQTHSVITLEGGGGCGERGGRGRERGGEGREIGGDGREGEERRERGGGWKEGRGRENMGIEGKKECRRKERKAELEEW